MIDDFVREITNLTCENSRLVHENKELKSKLELYENGVYYSSKLDEKEEEIEKLTKQLEVGKQQYNDLVEEIENLQEQLEDRW